MPGEDELLIGEADKPAFEEPLAHAEVSIESLDIHGEWSVAHGPFWDRQTAEEFQLPRGLKYPDGTLVRFRYSPAAEGDDPAGFVVE